MELIRPINSVRIYNQIYFSARLIVRSAEVCARADPKHFENGLQLILQNQSHCCYIIVQTNLFRIDWFRVWNKTHFVMFGCDHRLKSGYIEFAWLESSADVTAALMLSRAAAIVAEVHCQRPPVQRRGGVVRDSDQANSI